MNTVQKHTADTEVNSSAPAKIDLELQKLQLECDHLALSYSERTGTEPRKRFKLFASAQAQADLEIEKLQLECMLLRLTLKEKGLR